MNFNFVAPCYFGVEAAAVFDFKRIGAQNITVTDGRIAFSGDEHILAKANLWSRCAERVMILLKSFPARTFDELFDGVFSIPWENYIPKSGKFPVKGSSLSSTLSSVPACQSIVKKAVVNRLLKAHKIEFLPERGQEYRIRFSIRKDMAEVFLDTSGDGLHKRGYRRTAGIAPLKETLAAAIADFGRVRRGSLVQDPFCGSGTLVIEAALKALNIAPGLKRSFAAEHYEFLPAGLFDAARREAKEQELPDADFEGFGFDIDPEATALATANARLAGVGSRCRFATAPVARFAPSKSSIVLTNPPYGERLLDKADATALAKTLGEALAGSPVAGAYIITADGEFESHFGKRAAKRRKVYNGMIPCQIYMYY
ncbi:MAG: class I SAM-dependent RNA methyltransferase [Oscillospiraceae bacterium]